MTEEPLQQRISEMFARMQQDEKEHREISDALYDSRKMALVKDFMNGSNRVTLEELCSPEMSNFFFHNEGYPLIEQDEPSMNRKKIYGEGTLFCTYFFRDPTDTTGLNLSTTIDTVATRKPLPPKLKETLEELGFFSDTLIDFETFEFPHFKNETYYGLKCADEVRKLCSNLNIGNKDIAKEFRKGNSPLYRDTEKIHLQFAAGGNRNGEIRMLPVYIGIGTNEPYGLTFNGGLGGKSRFIKFRFDNADSGIERGELEEKFISSEEFKKRFKGITLNLINARDNWKLYSLDDEQPSSKYETFSTVTMDEERFKGFLKVYGSGEKEKGYLVNPKFKCTRVSQEDYLRALIHQTPLKGVQTVGNSGQIFGLLGEAIKFYDDFSAVQFEPGYLVREFGMDTVFKSVSTKLDGGQFNYANAINIASDVYNMSTFSWERLRVSSIVLGNYIQSGKFDELLHNVFRGEKTVPI